LIKANQNIHVSLDSIFNEILNISVSMEKCKLSIEQLDIKIDKLQRQSDLLYEDKIKREQRANIIWSIFQFSPGIFFKITFIFALAVLLSFLPFSEDFKTIVATYFK
jgi:hypothetical protein